MHALDGRSVGRVSNPSASSDDDAMFSTMIIATRATGRPATAAACTAMLTSCGAPVRYGSTHGSTTGGRRRVRAVPGAIGVNMLPPAALALAGRQPSTGSSEGSNSGLWERVFGPVRAACTPTVSAPHESGAGELGEGSSQPGYTRDRSQRGVAQHERAAGEAVPADGAIAQPQCPRASSTASSCARSVELPDAGHGCAPAPGVGQPGPASLAQDSVDPESGQLAATPARSPLERSTGDSQASGSEREPVSPVRQGSAAQGRRHSDVQEPLGTDASPTTSPSTSLQHLKELRQWQRTQRARSRESGGADAEASGALTHVSSCCSSPSPSPSPLAIGSACNEPDLCSSGEGDRYKMTCSTTSSTDPGAGRSAGSSSQGSGQHAAPGVSVRPDGAGGNGWRAAVPMHASPLPAPLIAEQRPQATMRSPAASVLATTTQPSASARSLAGEGNSDTGSLDRPRWYSPGSASGAPVVQTMACSDAEDPYADASACGSVCSYHDAGFLRDGAAAAAGVRRSGADLTAPSSGGPPARLTAHGQGLHRRRQPRSAGAAPMQHSGSLPMSRRRDATSEASTHMLSARSASAEAAAGVDGDGRGSAASVVRGESMRTVASSAVSVGRESVLSEAGMQPPQELLPHDELISPEDSGGNSEASVYTAASVHTAALSVRTAAGARSRANTARSAVASAALTPACSVRSEPPFSESEEPTGLVRDGIGAVACLQDVAGPVEASGQCMDEVAVIVEAILPVATTLSSCAGESAADAVLASAAVAALQHAVEACVHAPSLQSLASAEQCGSAVAATADGDGSPGGLVLLPCELNSAAGDRGAKASSPSVEAAPERQADGCQQEERGCWGEQQEAGQSAGGSGTALEGAGRSRRAADTALASAAVAALQHAVEECVHAPSLQSLASTERCGSTVAATADGDGSPGVPLPLPCELSSPATDSSDKESSASVAAASEMQAHGLLEEDRDSGWEETGEGLRSGAALEGAGRGSSAPEEGSESTAVAAVQNVVDTCVLAPSLQSFSTATRLGSAPAGLGGRLGVADTALESAAVAALQDAVEACVHAPSLQSLLSAERLGSAPAGGGIGPGAVAPPPLERDPHEAGDCQHSSTQDLPCSEHQTSELHAVGWMQECVLAAAAVDDGGETAAASRAAIDAGHRWQLVDEGPVGTDAVTDSGEYAPDALDELRRFLVPEYVSSSESSRESVCSSGAVGTCSQGNACLVHAVQPGGRAAVGEAGLEQNCATVSPGARESPSRVSLVAEQPTTAVHCEETGPETGQAQAGLGQLVMQPHGKKHPAHEALRGMHMGASTGTIGQSCGLLGGQCISERSLDSGGFPAYSSHFAGVVPCSLRGFLLWDEARIPLCSCVRGMYCTWRGVWQLICCQQHRRCLCAVLWE